MNFSTTMFSRHNSVYDVADAVCFVLWCITPTSCYSDNSLNQAENESLRHVSGTGREGNEDWSAAENMFQLGRNDTGLSNEFV